MDQRLETFLTVCATMNYRKAAEQLHLTQPAVTKQFRRLKRCTACAFLPTIAEAQKNAAGRNA